MLRNNYFLLYESPDKSPTILTSENKIIARGDNYKLYLERPLEQAYIKKIKDFKIYRFIDNIMCNKKINNLLYSSNAKKIGKFYIKQKKFLLKQHLPLNVEEDNLFRKKIILLSEKMKREKLMEDIKNNIIKFRKDRNKRLEEIKEKDNKFLNSQPNIDKKIEKLNSKSVNEITLKGYKKAFEKCLNLSLKRKNFDFVDFNSNDVFGRLYNNYVKIEKYKRNYSAENLTVNDSNSKNPLTFKKLLKNRKNKNNSERDLNQPYHKKIPKFILKSNLPRSISSLNQFNIGITKNIIQKCWNAISGGPKRQKEYKEKNKNMKEKFKKKFNYTILSNSIKGDKQDLSLYNTMVVNDPFLKKYRIKNRNYRDSQNNSSLHIAVSNNSIKLAKYFLNKKNKNLNARNNKGQTALHIACTMGNEDMINLLLQNGANVNVLDDKGKKPFDLLPSERSKNSYN